MMQQYYLATPDVDGFRGTLRIDIYNDAEMI